MSCLLYAGDAGLSVWVRWVSGRNEGGMGQGWSLGLGHGHLLSRLFLMIEGLRWMGRDAFWILGSSAASCC